MELKRRQDEQKVLNLIVMLSMTINTYIIEIQNWLLQNTCLKLVKYYNFVIAQLSTLVIKNVVERILYNSGVRVFNL